MNQTKKIIDIGINLFNNQILDPDYFLENHCQLVDKIILTTINKKSFEFNQMMINRYNNLYTTIGTHPHYAKDFNDVYYDCFNEINNKIVAIGEIGLDYNRNFSPKEIQIKVFENWLNYANTTNKSLFLHERDAIEDLLCIYTNQKNVNKTVIHCFTGNKDNLKRYLDNNFYIGITGWICDNRRNEDILNALQYIPINYLMFETDTPYLKPRTLKYKEKLNYPNNIHHIIEKYCEITKKDIDSVYNIVYNNTVNFFDLKYENTPQIKP